MKTKNKPVYYVMEDVHDDMIKNIISSKTPAYYDAFVYDSKDNIIDTFTALKKPLLLKRIRDVYPKLKERQNHPQSARKRCGLK